MLINVSSATAAFRTHSHLTSTKMWAILGRAATLTDLDGPAIEPPAGTTPNFDVQDRHHAVGYLVVIFCSILATLAVILRLASRYHMGRFHIEDVFLVMGLVCERFPG